MKTKSILPVIIIFMLGSCSNNNKDKAIHVDKQAPFITEISNAKTTKEAVLPSQKKFSVISVKGMAKPDPDPVVIHEEVRTLKTLYSKFEKPVQLIHINGSRDTILKLKEGTLLKIPAGTFIIKDKKTQVDCLLEISAREYYRVSDIIFGNLTTQWGDALLKSGGMINLEVRNNGSLCSVARGKTYEIGFPDKNNCKGMEMFEGTQNERGKIVWRHPENRLIESEAPKEIFAVVEEMPGFPGGDQERIKFIGQNFTYPEEAKELGIQGQVYTTFSVETDGSLKNIKVIRGIGGGCDEEAVKVIKAMPKWTPGKQRGVPVRVQFNLPINFVLDYPSNKIINKVAAMKDSGTQRQSDLSLKLSTLNSYFLGTNITGWINCDRFIFNKQGIIDYILPDPEADSTDLIMVLHKQKTIIAPLVKKKNFIFRNTPRNEAITLIGIKVINNKIYLALEDATTGQIIPKLTFKEVNDEGLKSALDQLDRSAL